VPGSVDGPRETEPAVFTESVVTFDSVPGVIGAVSLGPVRLVFVVDCVFVPLVD
jgi:hypothetical protein